jgi:hypothetical protein
LATAANAVAADDDNGFQEQGRAAQIAAIECQSGNGPRQAHEGDLPRSRGTSLDPVKAWGDAGRRIPDETGVPWHCQRGNGGEAASGGDGNR